MGPASVLLAEAVRGTELYAADENRGDRRCGGGKVAGCAIKEPRPGELRAELTVACDGRWLIARHEAD